MLNKNEVTTMNTELKMKQKMLSTMEEKIKKVEGPAAIADQLLEKIKVSQLLLHPPSSSTLKLSQSYVLLFTLIGE